MDAARVAQDGVRPTDPPVEISASPTPDSGFPYGSPPPPPLIWRRIQRSGDGRNGDPRCSRWTARRVPHPTKRIRKGTRHCPHPSPARPAAVAARLALHPMPARPRSHTEWGSAWMKLILNMARGSAVGGVQACARTDAGAVDRTRGRRGVAWTQAGPPGVARSRSRRSRSGGGVPWAERGCRLTEAVGMGGVVMETEGTCAGQQGEP